MDLKEYIAESLLEESVLKAKAVDDANGFPGPLMGLFYKTDTDQWLKVTKIEIEDASIFGEKADKGMCYCTLTFGSLCKTKQIPLQKSIKEKCKDNNGYNWMPSPKLLADIVDYFGSDRVTFDIDDNNLKGVKWNKMGHGADFETKVRKTNDPRFSK